jgi:hypothetical protein
VRRRKIVGTCISSNNKSLKTSNLAPGVPEYGHIGYNSSAVLRLLQAWLRIRLGQFTGNVGILHPLWKRGRAPSSFSDADRYDIIRKLLESLQETSLTVTPLNT